MKKHATVVLSCTFAVVLLIGATTAFAVQSPNYATNEHNDLSFFYSGYVQCQPSFVENGNHAARGYIHYQRYDLLGNVNKDTGRLYTEYGNGPTDSRILSRSEIFTDSPLPNSYKTQFWYGFDWVSDDGSWPFSFSDGAVTE